MIVNFGIGLENGSRYQWNPIDQPVPVEVQLSLSLPLSFSLSLSLSLSLTLFLAGAARSAAPLLRGDLVDG